jgi:hypothetical protein
LWLLFAALAALPSPSPAAPASHRLATVQRAEADRVVFRVRVPDPRLIPGRALKDTERLEIDGYSRIGDPGAPPTLTHTFLVGLPAEGAYTLTYRLISSTPLGTHRLEPVATPIGIRDDDLGPTSPRASTGTRKYFKPTVIPLWSRPTRSSTSVVSARYPCA